MAFSLSPLLSLLQAPAKIYSLSALLLSSQTLIKLLLTFLPTLLQYLLLIRLRTLKGMLSFPSNVKYKNPWYTRFLFVETGEILCGRFLRQFAFGLLYFRASSSKGSPEMKVLPYWELFWVLRQTLAISRRWEILNSSNFCLQHSGWALN